VIFVLVTLIGRAADGGDVRFVTRELTRTIRLTTIDGSGRQVAVSSRGQDTWFSATGPGFDSPYRYQAPTYSWSVSSEGFRGGISAIGEALSGGILKDSRSLSAPPIFGSNASN
jgi:hypothetical protein